MIKFGCRIWHRLACSIESFSKAWRQVITIAKPFWLADGWRSVISLAALSILTAIGFAGLYPYVAHAGDVVARLAAMDTATAATLIKQWLPPLLLLAGGMSWLLWRYASTSDNASGIVLLGLQLLVILFTTAASATLGFLTAGYTNALQARNAEMFYKMIYLYGGMFTLLSPVFVMETYLRDKLSLVWRRSLTRHLQEKYFRNRNYYRISTSQTIDNPDERICQDIPNFCNGALKLFLAVFGSAIRLGSFFTILWFISVKLVAVTIIYATFGTIVTLLFGWRLVGLNFNQSRCEGNLRYGLVHVRNNAESIAFYRGESQEAKQVGRRLEDALGNFGHLIAWQRNLSFFTGCFDFFIIIIPILVMAPRYFAGTILLGAISQASLAFFQVLSSLSLIVNSFSDVSQLAANINRLATFIETLEAEAETGRPDKSLIENNIGDSCIALNHVTVMTPDYKHTLVKDLSLKVAPGSSLVVVGPSGCGKSSLLRVLAGLWQSGSGTITRPDQSEMLFLPQRPYMILGSLREQLLYPNVATSIPDRELIEILNQVNLPDLAGRVGGLDATIDLASRLSLGEQQRVSFVRLLLSKPRYAILDEATSALDMENEERLYELLKASGTTFISVGHRQSLWRHHKQKLEFTGCGAWQITPTD